MKSENATPKKTYSTPNLTVYGDIRTITQVSPNAGAYDNRSMTAFTH
jgi:hypothetical protein